MVDLDSISHDLMIIAGFIMSILGLFGNILNICVFYIWSHSRTMINKHQQNQRTSNSPLYLLTSSISNFILIGYALTTRIII